MLLALSCVFIVGAKSSGKSHGHDNVDHHGYDHGDDSDHPDNRDHHDNRDPGNHDHHNHHDDDPDGKHIGHHDRKLGSHSHSHGDQSHGGLSDSMSNSLSQSDQDQNRYMTFFNIGKHVQHVSNALSNEP